VVSDPNVARKTAGGQAVFAFLPAPDFTAREDDIEALTRCYRQEHERVTARGQEGAIPRLRDTYSVTAILHAAAQIARAHALREVARLAEVMADDIAAPSAETVLRGEEE
jgi:hypothetical protein